MKHQLQMLSPGAFQSCAAGLAIAEFGSGVQVLGSGRDGGRDMYFHGPLTWNSTGDSEEEQFDGYTVFQVKHKETLSDKNATNVAWLWEEVRKELDAWTAWDKDKPREPLPDQLVFITNVLLTPYPSAGGHDTLLRQVQKYRDALNDGSRDIDSPEAILDKIQRRKRLGAIRTIRFWDGNQVDTLLTVHAGVRRRFDAFLTVSDVFAFVTEMTGNAKVKDSVPVLLDQARTELSTDGVVYFDDAGDRENRGIPIHTVAIDLPVTFAGGTAMRTTALKHVLERGDNILARDITAVTGPRHLVLTGQPGNGKTTMSKLIVQAYRAAALKGSNALSESHAGAITGIETVLRKLGHRLPKHHRWPLRIDLAKYAEESGHKLDETLMRYLADRISTRSTQGDVTPATLSSWLKEWPWVVVFDGLDEVTEPKARRTVIQRLTEFVNNAEADKNDLLAVITTRPVGYTEDIDPNLFQTVALDDLTPTEALRYGMQAAKVRIGADVDRVQKVVDALAAAAQDENLAKLLRTPLQVLILSIIIDGAGDITPDRYSLFWSYFDTVFRRERGKGQMVRTLLTKHDQLIHQLHHRAGFVLQQRAETAEHSTAILTEQELRQIAWHVLDEAKFKPDGDNADILDSIIKSATQRLVLIAPRNDGYGFDVRSLQEMMASLHIGNAPMDVVLERLRVLAPSPHWRNTWLFTGGKFFSEPRRHEHAAVVELVETVDRGAHERFGDHLPIGYELALDILDDGMARKWPEWSNRLLAHGLHVLDEPSTYNLDRSLRILLRYADSGKVERAQMSNALRENAVATADRRILTHVAHVLPALERDLRVRESTLGFADLVRLIAKTPQPNPHAPDWSTFDEEIQTNPHGPGLTPVIEEGVACLKSMSISPLRTDHGPGLAVALSEPKVARVLDAALTHVLPGDFTLFHGLRQYMADYFRLPVGDKVLGPSSPSGQD